MSVTTRAKIAVTGPDQSGLTAWLFTALNVYLAGGKPIRVTPDRFDNRFDFDGVIIGGGSDIHPENIEKEQVKKVDRPFWLKCKERLLYPMELYNRLVADKATYDKERDEMEKRFIEYALSYNKPILGICRGHQLINSSLGGTMYQSTLPLLSDAPRIRSPFPRKKVLYTKDNSLIAEIAGDDPLQVNAIHSQAIARPANSLEVTAKEEAGINQVVESKNNENVLGVQWHPEYLFYMKAHRNIFKWLVKKAEK